MTGGSWADVQVYSEMIDELGRFCASITECCNTMEFAALTCKANMENDAASLKAEKNVLKSARELAVSAQMAKKLAEDLEEERQAIIVYLHSLEELDGE